MQDLEVIARLERLHVHAPGKLLKRGQQSLLMVGIM